MANITISEIKKNIQNWDVIRNSSAAFTLLNSGFGFNITKTEFLSWIKCDSDIQDIHIYLGLDSMNKLIFYLVDNITDKEGANDSVYSVGKNLFIKNLSDINKGSGEHSNDYIPYLKISNKSGLDASIILQRVLTWQMYGLTWFEKTRQNVSKPITNTNEVKNIGYSGIVKVFSLPFSDLTTIFSNEYEETEAYAFFGMSHNSLEPDGFKNYLELIICNNVKKSREGEDIIEIFKDVTKPKPPFTITNEYNLF